VQYTLPSFTAVVIAADVLKLALYPKLAKHTLSMTEQEPFGDLSWKVTPVRVYPK